MDIHDKTGAREKIHHDRWQSTSKIFRHPALNAFTFGIPSLIAVIGNEIDKEINHEQDYYKK